MNRFIASLSLIYAISLVALQSAQAVTIPTVPVGDAGNANDPFTGSLYGGVGYAYRIGTTEVTNAQYAEFLNAKAASDPLSLYNTNMGGNARGGISQSGVSGSFTYAIRPNMGDKPVNFVSWYDSIRFANWLNNGQGSGDTETGAYTLLGGTATPSNGLSITRNAAATWVLTSENEWYKAAYYQPGAQWGGVHNFGYALYPFASNGLNIPTPATADAAGNISNPGASVVNAGNFADWNGQDGNVTTVGSAGPLSNSFYGTADQGGNVAEWNEALIASFTRGVRGSSWNNLSPDSGTAASSRVAFTGNPTFELSGVGFRVATVPEPSTAVLAIIGCALMLWCRRRVG